MEVRATSCAVRRLRESGSPALVDATLSLAAIGLLTALITADDNSLVDQAFSKAGPDRDRLLEELERHGYLLRRSGQAWTVSDDPAELKAETTSAPGDHDTIREGVALARKAITQATGSRPRPGTPSPQRPAVGSTETDSHRHLEASGFFAGDFGIHRDREGRPAMGERADAPAPCVICGRQAESVFGGAVVHVPCYWVSTCTQRADLASPANPDGRGEPGKTGEDPS